MNKYIKRAVFAFMAVSIMGCSDDFLETYPTDSVSTTEALSSPKNMMAALNGVHRAMYGQSTFEDYSLAAEGYILPMMEYGASDALHSTSGNGWFRSNLRWLVHTDPNRSDMEYVWYHHYNIIGSVNNIINAAIDNEMTVTPELSNILGQCYAYRAWAHHRLVTLYAKSYTYGTPATDPGVPIMTKTAAPFEGQARASVEAVYTQCENDIKKSIEYFENATKADDNSHISMKTAKGIAARIALTKGDYVNAATYANEARDGFALKSENEYKQGFNNFEDTEVMWAGDIVPDQTTYYRAWFYYIGTNFNGSQNRGNPKFINHELYKLIGDNDYRKDMWLETAPNTIDVEFDDDGNVISGDDNYATSTEFWAAWRNVVDEYEMTTSFNTYPYMSVKFRNANGGTIDPDDVLYMRASEMYLIEAEALAMQGGKDTEAIAVITELANARRKDNTVAYDVTARGLSLIEEIKVQRRIELWGEGHRWVDMKRFDEALDLTNSGADETLYQKGFKQDKPSINSDWIYKIPQAEINANPNISEEDQN
ncbi:RagB/SusD family nutrient uptake outer membrane protein [Marinifilum breve]|uniref:RagB/SusD family nutrient uptake outer membrane protein n=1 Tax=Marinifilum breve TaxID=2184082 RepID=A0A2V3ZVW4_9BACT|nr:RagB/SusD family nutrient uptake outer membrane protein [Marinifilum breve]PXX99217.1 RagB/SusD family nutrient uptake outer membrane protein [Marinifilum breve]